MGGPALLPLPSPRRNPNKFRVKVLAADGVTLQRRRHVAYGQIVPFLSTPSKTSPPINQSFRDFR